MCVYKFCFHVKLLHPSSPEHPTVIVAGQSASSTLLSGTPQWGCRAAALPWRTKVWLVSRRISQPSVIIRSMARFLRMFSVSLTSSCMILGRQEVRDMLVHFQGGGCSLSRQTQEEKLGRGPLGKEREGDLYLSSANCMLDTGQAPSGLIPWQSKLPGAYFRKNEREIGTFQC